MDREDAIAFALAHRPESVGIARLCQELLADVTGQSLTAQTPCPIDVRTKSYNIGNRNNPWGRRGKPK